MQSLLPIFIIALVIVALGGWVLAISAAFKVWSMSAPGEKFSNYMRLGLLQTSYLESRLGPSIRPTLVRYRNGLLLFLACVIIVAVVSILAASA
ncbi:MAG TPA: hypothetical protein VMF90_23905 [Rhizobiaceae bacterium]|jgi:hypothetical protein|nr:hypothetical protein [Rhizobiaceae bacterium]